MSFTTRLALRLGTLSVIALALGTLGGCGLTKPKPKKPFGEACTSPFDCESMKCNTERGNMCTKECHNDADCGGDYVCAGDPTGTSASCSKKVGQPTGSNCRDRSECDHGSCLHKGEEENGFCSARCKTSADCPAGFKVCEKISDMGAQKLCLPGAAADSAPPKIGVKKVGTPAGAAGAAGGSKPPTVAPKKLAAGLGRAPHVRGVTAAGDASDPPTSPRRCPGRRRGR